MTVNVVIAKKESVEKMKETVIKIVSAKMVMFVAQIIVPLEVISIWGLIVAQKYSQSKAFLNNK